jgi:hypothetical protein
VAVYDAVGRRDVRQDQVLTNISVGWPQGGPMVGERLFPTVRVRKQSNKYYVFGRESWAMEPGGDVRAPGTVANEIPGLELSTDTYFAIEHALQIPVTDEERENADNILSPERDGTELVTAKIWLGRELAMRDMVTTAGNFAADQVETLAGSTQWSHADSDPIADVRNAKLTIHSKLFVEPNVAVIPYLVMHGMMDHPDFIERIKYSERAILTPELIATLLGLSQVIVPGMGMNTARAGQTENLTYVWGKDVLLAYVPPRAGLKIPAFAYEFAWSYPRGGPQEVTRWREEQRKSDVIRVGRRYDLKFVAKDDDDKAIGAYLFKNVVA